jgi:cell wall-associated NlpC family hydrolase
VSTQAAAVVAAAKSQVGYKETGNNDNKFGVWYGANHQSWCAMFVSWCFDQAHALPALEKFAYCPALESWAHSKGMIVPIAQVQAGDVLLFDWTHKGIAEHTGIATGPIDPHTHLLPTIEGNTGPDHIGVNQSNGDGVYAKVRNPILVRAVIRPKWTA